MTRALVLGGGGPVGIGWESGLAVGLASAGVDLRTADLVVGTSAGSAVGAQLTLGMDVAQAPSLVAGVAPAQGDVSMEVLLTAMAAATAGASSLEEALRAVGRVAIESATFDEELFVAMFARIADTAWPDGFACTAVDVETAELTIWNAQAGAPLDRAVASSCALPGVFPPVTIGGRRYMDGGMRSPLNADLAVGHDRVVAVSCLPLALPEGVDDPVFTAMTEAVRADLEEARAAGGRVEVIVPGAEFLDVSGWGLNLMDFGRTADAYAAGVRQAADEAVRIAALWNG